MYLLAIPMMGLVIYTGAVAKANLEKWQTYSALGQIMDVSVEIGSLVHRKEDAVRKAISRILDRIQMEVDHD